jgi:hypothetical protein
MQPYQQRVVEEAEQLDERIDKLFAFTDHPQFKLIPEDERDRMYRQLDAMRLYSLILHERIEAFT